MAGPSQGASSASADDLRSIYTTGRSLPSSAEVTVTALVMVHGAGLTGLDALREWANNVRQTWPQPPPSKATSKSSNPLPDMGKPPRSWTGVDQNLTAYAKRLIQVGTCKDKGVSYPIKGVLENRDPPVYTTTEQVRSG